MKLSPLRRAKSRAEAAPKATLEFSPSRLTILYCLICVLLTLRFPEPLTHPWTFVSEEGTVFFQDAYNLGFWQGLFAPYAGYCTIAARLIAYACRVLPYRTLPFAYSFLSLLVAAAVLSFFYLPHFRHVMRRDWQRFAVCLGLCAAPACPLLQLQLIHFYLATLLALIAIMELPHSAQGRAAVVIAALIAVWSAPSGIVVIPLFLYRCVRGGVYKSDRMVWGGLLLASLGYIANVWMVGHDAVSHLDLKPIPAELWHSFAYRVAGVGLIGEKWTDQLVSSHGWYAVLPFLLLVVAFSLVLLTTERQQGRPLFPVLAILWASLATSGLIALRPFSGWYFSFDHGLAYWPNDRYFFPATTLLFLCLGILWSRQRGKLKPILTILLTCWCCSLYLWGYSFHYWNTWGPSFQPYWQQLEKTEREAAADGKIHKLVFPTSPKLWLVTLDVGKHKRESGAPQETAPSTQRLTDFFDLDQDLSGQRHSSWFGSFDDSKYPWVHHKVYGWMSCLGTGSGGIWFYSKDLDAFWTDSWTFPRVFAQRPNAWVTLQPVPESDGGAR